MRAKQAQRGLLIGVLLLISFWLATSIWGLFEKAHIAVSQASEAKWQYNELEKRKATLVANLAALDTPRGKETAIRSSFGVARPGEEVIVVVPPVVATATPEQSWWQKLLSWF